MINYDFVKYENDKRDEYIRLDTTIIGIDNLIAKASTAEEANALFKAKDVIYSQQQTEQKILDEAGHADELRKLHDTEEQARGGLEQEGEKMTCWCDDCCHNRDFECQLGASIEITADHECDSFVDYIDTEAYKQVFYRRVEHDGVQYKRRCYGKREEQNGIVFYHRAKGLGSEVLCTEEKTGMLFPHRVILYEKYIVKMKEMIERYTSVDTLPDEPEAEG